MSGLPGRRNNGLSLILEDLSPTVRYEKRFKSYLAPKQSGLTAKQIDETGERFCILGFLCCEKSVEAIFISNETTEGEFYPALSHIQYHALPPWLFYS